MSQEDLAKIISLNVANALATYETNWRNGEDSQGSRSDERRMVHTTRECTYSDFLKCQALNYKGTKGAVGLAQWFERMETVLHINKCIVECQVKFVSYTLLGGALTWWNSHVRTVGHDVAYEMPWNILMKMMTENYCLRREKKILETELWNLVVKDKAERYTSGLPDSIQGSVMASKPKKLQEAIKLARSLMLRRRLAAANNQNATRTIQKTVTCFECRKQGHYKKDFLKLKNQGHGNAIGHSEARGKAYVLGGGESNLDFYVVNGTFLLNNHYASILFDTDANRGFVSTTFSLLIDIIPSKLDNYCDVELADGKIIRVNTIIRGCTLKFFNHPFNIDLMPIELSSSDVIIGRIGYLCITS
nr:reverse transcriptase domain-containing protein [Tanacetum cinerariifolium]